MQDDITLVVCYDAGMVAADEQFVGETLRSMAAVHRVQYTNEMYRGYWAALKDLSRAQFAAAAEHLLKNAMWMPKPAEFRAFTRRGWM